MFEVRERCLESLDSEYYLVGELWWVVVSCGELWWVVASCGGETFFVSFVCFSIQSTINSVLLKQEYNHKLNIIMPEVRECCL